MSRTHTRWQRIEKGSPTGVCRDCLSTFHVGKARAPRPQRTAPPPGAMDPKDRAALCEIVREAVRQYGEKHAEAVIFDAHNGRPRAFVTDANLHLFRQYRNRISGNGYHLIREATAGEDR